MCQNFNQTFPDFQINVKRLCAERQSAATFQINSEYLYRKMKVPKIPINVDHNGSGLVYGKERLIGTPLTVSKEVFTQIFFYQKVFTQIFFVCFQKVFTQIFF